MAGPLPPDPVTRSSVDGNNARLGWMRYVSFMGTGPFSVAADGGLSAGDRLNAGRLSAEFSLRDPTISALAQYYLNMIIGAGLRISAKPDPIALNIDSATALDLSKEIERRFNQAANSTQLSYDRRSSLTDLCEQVLRSMLIWGEAFVSVEARKDRDAQHVTRFSVLDPRTVDSTKTTIQPAEDGSRTVQGVVFKKNGTVRGYWIHDAEPGSWKSGQSRFVSAETPWGRPKIIHILNRSVSPAQVRGAPLLLSALSSAQEMSVLNELLLARAQLQASVAITIESPAPNQAIDALTVDNVASGGTQSTFEQMVENRAAFHSNSKVQLNSAVVSALAPGETLKMTTPASTAAEFEAMTKSLRRQAASGVGADFSLAYADMSESNYSSARLGTELPARQAARWREQFLGKFLRAVYRCFLEEQLLRGLLPMPEGENGFATPFLADVEGWCRIAVLGPSRPVADKLKDYQAQELAAAANLDTLESILSSSGLDFSEVVEQRRIENEQLRAAGLPVPGEQPQPKNEQPDAATDEVTP
jgi:lambda family phage portal protein